MAKLFNVEGDNKKVVKAIFLVVAFVALMVPAFVHYDISKGNEKEDDRYYIGVHVKGATVNTGFYAVPYGTRVRDLEKYVGGFSENADLDGVNLAEYVYDGQEIYIPYKGSSASGALNLNTVTYNELLEVDGIGATTARKIINYRDEHNSFEKVIELKDVVGAKMYEQVREKFYVN